MTLNRQTGKEAFKAVEREIRANPDMASYIRATYAPTTIINKIASKNWVTDRLAIKASLIAELPADSWQTVIKPMVKQMLLNR